MTKKAIPPPGLQALGIHPAAPRMVRLSATCQF
jgi:hypothetical protein